MRASPLFLVFLQVGGGSCAHFLASAVDAGSDPTLHIAQNVAKPKKAWNENHCLDFGPGEETKAQEWGGNSRD